MNLTPLTSSIPNPELKPNPNSNPKLIEKEDDQDEDDLDALLAADEVGDAVKSVIDVSLDDDAGDEEDW
jgi:hypothetical protein